MKTALQHMRRKQQRFTFALYHSKLIAHRDDAELFPIIQKTQSLQISNPFLQMLKKSEDAFEKYYNLYLLYYLSAHILRTLATVMPTY